MAVTFARECRFPQNLDAAFLEMEQDLGDRLVANQALLQDLVDSSEGIEDLINEGNSILEDILKNSDGTSPIRTLADLSEYFGLPKDESTTLEDEIYLADAGVIVKDKVFYVSGARSGVPGDLDNVNVLRRLYFAVGRDLAKVQELLDAKTKTFFVYNRLTVRRIPPKRPNAEAFSLDDIRAFLGRDELTSDNIAVLSDYSTLVSLADFLTVDATLAEVRRRYGLQDHEILVDVFHFGSADNSTQAIARYEANGFTGTKLAAILNGTDLVENQNTNTVPADLDAVNEKVSVIVQEIAFVIQRLRQNLFSRQLLQNFRNKTRLSIEALQTDHQQIMADTNFKVSVILQKNTLEKLKEKHSDPQIRELLERRPDVLGVYFDPPDELLASELTRAMNSSPPGSNTISNRFLNNKTYPTVSAGVLMLMAGDLQNARDAMSAEEITTLDLQKANGWLISYTGRNPSIKQQLEENPNGVSSNPATSAIAGADGQLVDPSTGQVVSTDQAAAANALYDSNPLEPGVASPIDSSGRGTDATSGLGAFQGQPSWSTPSSLLVSNFDAPLTMNMDDRVAALNEESNEAQLKEIYPDSVAKPLAKLISRIATFFQEALKAINFIMDLFEKGVGFLKKKMDAFMSKYSGLVGKGSFENSILACAVNLNLDLSTSLLDNLLVLLNNLMALYSQFFSKMLAWVTDMLEKLICFPLNLINAIIGSVNTALALPNLCKSKLTLNADLEAALAKLAAVGNIKVLQMKSFSRDLFRAKLDFAGAADQLGQFNSSSRCNSGSMNTFINSALINVGGGAGVSIGF